MLQFNHVTLSHLHRDYLKITPSSKEAITKLFLINTSTIPSDLQFNTVFPDPPSVAETGPKSWEISKFGERTTLDSWQVPG